MSISRIILAAGATVLAATLAPVAKAATCPYAAAGYPDGCAAAPATGAYRQSTFSTYARQSGQKWVSSHPQPWAVAGWDYAVGYSKKTAHGMYPLLKPDLATAGGDGSGANLPYASAGAGCAYTATGNTLIPGSPAIICSGQLPNNGVGVYAGKPVISGIDFSADSAGNCVQLIINLRSTQTVYVVNNNFKKGPACYTPGGTLSDALLRVIAGPVGLVLYDNVFNGMAPYQSDAANLVEMNGTGPVDARYNAFLNASGRAISGDGRSGWTLKYNYFDGMAISAGSPHGEMAGTFAQTDGATIAYQDWEFNTAVWGGNTVGVDGVNAGVFMSGGGNGQTLGLGQMLNNTFVSNLEYGGKNSSGKLFLSIQIPYLNSLVIKNNYGDPTGSWYCLRVDGDEINIAGYIDDGQGPGGAYDGLPGNVLHVTARTGKDFIVTGATLYQSAGSGLPGNPAITGAAGSICNGVAVNGATGSIALQTAPFATYCISGPPVAVAAFSGVQTMPQIGSVSFSGNVNLRDRSAITLGADLPGGTGLCNGRY